MASRYPKLELLARTALSDGKYRSTNALAAEIYPQLTPEMGLQDVYKALAWEAIHDMSDCARRGPTGTKRIRKQGGAWVTVTRRPWEWGQYGSRNDEAKGFCPNCGFRLPHPA